MKFQFLGEQLKKKWTLAAFAKLFSLSLECATIPSFAPPRHTATYKRACACSIICQSLSHLHTAQQFGMRLECAAIPSFALPRHTATRACSICQGMRYNPLVCACSIWQRNSLRNEKALPNDEST
eukprot:sb/3475684/